MINDLRTQAVVGLIYVVSMWLYENSKNLFKSVKNEFRWFC